MSGNANTTLSKVQPSIQPSKQKKAIKNTVPNTSSIISKLALIVRGITVPPVLVSAVLILLYFLTDAVFTHLGELVFSLLFLVGIPLAAYPLARFVPRLRKKGRKSERTLAFILSFVGYAGSLLYGAFAPVGKPLMLIFVTYFISVVILILFNKGLKIHASGHACSTTGPLVFLVYFLGPQGIIPCLLVGAAVVWSSLYLKRHKLHELALGVLSALIAFGISLAFLTLL